MACTKNNLPIDFYFILLFFFKGCSPWESQIGLVDGIETLITPYTRRASGYCSRRFTFPPDVIMTHMWCHFLGPAKHMPFLETARALAKEQSGLWGPPGRCHLWEEKKEILEWEGRRRRNPKYHTLIDTMLWTFPWKVMQLWLICLFVCFQVEEHVVGRDGE